MFEVLQRWINSLKTGLFLHWIRDEFPYFWRSLLTRLSVYTMVPYEEKLVHRIQGYVIDRGSIQNTLTDILSREGFTIFKTSQKEKGPHVNMARADFSIG